MTSAELLRRAVEAAPVGLSWLLTYAVHSTLLLGAAWLVTRRMIESHAVREVVWKAALLGSVVTATLQVSMGIIPVTGSVALAGIPRSTFVGTKDVAVPLGVSNATRPLSSVQTPESGTPTVTAAAGSAAPFFPLSVSEGTSPATRNEAASPNGGQPSERLPTATLGFFVWCGLAALLLAGFLLRRVQLSARLGRRESVRAGRLAELLAALRRAAGIRRPIRLTMAPGLSSPVALGSSEICVPDAAVTELEADQQRSMLAHELAHLDRLDPHWLTLACLLERAFFFQPLNHVARRHMQDAAEFLCDDWAVRRTGSGLTLAKCLVKVAEWLDATPHAVPLSGIAEQRSQLVSRIHRLIENRAMITQPKRPWLLPLAAVLLVATVAAAPGVTTQPRTPASRDSLELSSLPQAAVVDTPPAATDSSNLSDLDGTTMRSNLRHIESRLTRMRMLTAERMATRYATRAPIAPMAVAAPSMPRYGRPPMPAIAPIAPRALTMSPVLAPGMPASARRSLELLAETRGGRGHDTTGVAVPALIAALRDPEVNVRRAAAQSLGNLEDPRAVPGLIEALHDSDIEVKKDAAEALGNLGDRRAVDGLSATLKDASAEVREAAASALGELQDARSADALSGALRDTSAAVRRSAASALSQMKDPRAVEPLIAALKDADPEVRQMSANSLGELADKRAVRPLA
ncbi:MAG: M56 family metallopeptidase, partial [Gemmatimonadota bacterium]